MKKLLSSPIQRAVILAMAFPLLLSFYPSLAQTADQGIVITLNYTLSDGTPEAVNAVPVGYPGYEDAWWLYVNGDAQGDPNAAFTVTDPLGLYLGGFSIPAGTPVSQYYVYDAAGALTGMWINLQGLGINGEVIATYRLFISLSREIPDPSEVVIRPVTDIKPVTVNVHYIDQNNQEFASEQRNLKQGANVVTPDASYVPVNYQLTSAGEVVVRVNEFDADPTEVNFMYINERNFVLIGEAKGFGGLIQVIVTLEENKIVEVDAVGENETEGIGTMALEDLPNKIVEANSTEIDSITGATYTSEGIKSAVKDALTNTGMWSIRFYVDEFNDFTNEKYLTNMLDINGTFENSATRNSDLDVRLIINDNKNIEIVLFEYGGNNPVKVYSPTQYTVKIKDSTGEVVTLEAKNNFDRLVFDSNDSMTIHNILQQNGRVSFYIVENDYSFSIYRFTIEDSSYYLNAYRMLID